MLKKILVSLTATILILGGITMSNAKQKDWDKTFAKSDKVDVQKVNFKNRYEITLVGDLYLQKKKPKQKWRRLQYQDLLVL